MQHHGIFSKKTQIVVTLHVSLSLNRNCQYNRDWKAESIRLDVPNTNTGTKPELMKLIIVIVIKNESN